MIWSCLQGVMGEIYVDDVDNPQSAAAYLADFVFFSGKPCKELVQYHYSENFIIMVAQDPRWDALIADCYGEQAKAVTRYAIKKEPSVFDTDQLKSYAAALILACLERDWYPSWDAANMASVRLAEKLGYHFDHEYTAWDIGWNPR